MAEDPFNELPPEARNPEGKCTCDCVISGHEIIEYKTVAPPIPIYGACRTFSCTCTKMELKGEPDGQLGAPDPAID